MREEDIPMPSFGESTRRRARRLRFQDSAESVGNASDVGTSSSADLQSANGGHGGERGGPRAEHGGPVDGLLS